jgi:hypothetical protein
MNPTPQQAEYAELDSPDAATSRPGINVDQAGPLVLPPATESTDQWKEWGKQISEVLAELPDYVTNFFADNRRPIVTVGLIFTAFLALKLTLALLDAINDIPLLAPTFELVGLGYTSWFVYRYLLQASTRQELTEEINNFKSQIVGRDSDLS